MKHSERWAALEAAINEPFSLQGAEVVSQPRPAKITFSARIPSALSPEIIELAEAEDFTPSGMIAKLVEEALVARRAAKHAPVDIRWLHDAIDQLAHNQKSAA